MIVFMGVAGAGKSVQGKLLARDLGFQWISTGEILRANLSGNRKKELLSGKLVGDEELIDLMDKVLGRKDGYKKCILDGFPRTLSQAEWLFAQHEDKRCSIEALIWMDASEEVVKKRLLSRGRQDDNSVAITNRFEEYKKSTVPIITSFRNRGVAIVKVDAEQSVEAVHQDILSGINKICQNVH